LPRLFSYGTLQLPQVQQAIYGRLLEGAPDALTRYRLDASVISDTEVVCLSGKPVHTIARFTGDPGDRIEGQCFVITEEELAATDSYEVDVYGRTEVELKSGVSALVYVGPPLTDTPASGQDHS